MDQIAIGDAQISRVVEWLGPVIDASTLFPDTPPTAWSDLDPTFFDAATGRYRAAIQTWVIRVAGMTVLVDTGVGNDRTRPQVPAFDHLHTDFPQRLTTAGIRPEDVDIVINTHIHYDHVGWNTRRAQDDWVPTFPNARYVIPKADYDYFAPENADRMRPPDTEDERRRFEGIRHVFQDSIAPIAAAGQIHLWSGTYEIDDVLRLEQAPGHTPGSSVLWLRDGKGAVFVGDLLHSPMQLRRPDDRCAFDLDAATARATRRRILNQAAQQQVWLLPAHFAGRGAPTIEADGDAFAIQAWTGLSEY